MAQPRSLSSMFSMRNPEEKTVDEHIVDRMSKLFPGLRKDGIKDPARAAIMGAISNVGAYAFGAYDEPNEEGWKEETANQNVIQHLKCDWVNEVMEGVLKITLKDAQNLIDADILFQGNSDPYVIFACGGSFLQSAAIHDTQNPVWNSTHYLFLRKRHLEPRTDKELVIRCMDKDTREGFGSIINWIDGDDHLGTAKVPLEQLKQEGVQSHSLELVIGRRRRKKPSIINFTTEYISVEAALKECKMDKASACWIEKKKRDIKKGANWPDLTKKTDIGLVNVEKVAFIDAKTTGTQAWIHVNTGAKTVVVAFRGTEMNRLKDVIADLRFVPVSLSPAMKSAEYAMKPTRQLLDKRIKVHGGFRDAYDSIRESVLRIVYDITGWSEEWTTVVTGHSLGGALATLCAFEFENRVMPHEQQVWMSAMRAMRFSPQLPPIAPKVGMMNFGAPRVGTQPFVDIYNATVDESLRVINANDLVHFLPPLFFRHTKYEVLLQESGEVDINGIGFQSGHTREIKEQIQNGSLKEEDLVTKAFSRLSILQHLGSHYYTLAEAAVEKFRERMEGLFDGDGESSTDPKKKGSKGKAQASSSKK